MSKTVLRLRHITLAPPSIGPMVAGKLDQLTMARLGHDDALGRPLLIGALPLACAHTGGDLGRALFTPWHALSFGRQASSIGLMAFDQDWLRQHDGPCLIFLVHAQPPGLQLPDIRPGVLRPFAPLPEALAHFEPDNTHHDCRPALCRAIWRAMRLLQGHAQDVVPHLPSLSPRSAPAPQPARTTTRFVLGSCLYPGGMLEETPYPGDWCPAAADQSMALLHDLRTKPSAPPLDFALLVGDQVYLDATAGLFDPAMLADRFGAPYLKWLGRPMVRRALAGLPVHTMLDDHELTDNWEPVHPQARSWHDEEAHPSVHHHNRDLLAKGLISYLTFQGPVIHAPQGLSRPKLWRLVGTHEDPEMVFMADTRTRRQLRNTRTVDRADIMDTTQFDALCDWLRRSGQHPTQARFLACPTMLLPRRRLAVGPTPASALHSDAWDGFPHAMHRLLANLYEHDCRNVVLLSGDEHLASVSFVDIRKEGAARTVRIHVVHTPGLYTPFPFANARPIDFLTPDAFDFSWPDDAGTPARYHCNVQTWFAPPINGFVLIDAPRQLDPENPIRLGFMLSDSAQVHHPAPVPDQGTSDIVTLYVQPAS